MRWIEADAPVVIGCATDTGAAPKTAVSADRARRGYGGKEASGMPNQAPIFFASSMIVSPTASQSPSALKSRFWLGPCSCGRFT